MLNNNFRGINRKKADDEIAKGKEIEDITCPIMKAAFALAGNTQGRIFYNEPFNAFLFDAASVLKFFYGTDDFPLPPKEAPTHLIVIEGAENIDETVGGIDYKGGQRTAIIAGISEAVDDNGDPVLDNSKNPVLRLIPPDFATNPHGPATPNQIVAVQYPPRYVFTRLPLSGDVIDIILVK